MFNKNYESNNSIGNNIRKWRQLKGFKQDNFANQIGISKSTLSKIENDRQGIGVLRLQLIASCLKIKATDLFKNPNDLLSPPLSD